jgi:hypothetical protein
MRLSVPPRLVAWVKTRSRPATPSDFGRAFADLNREHAAERAHLPRRDGMLRVRRESGIVNALDAFVALEVLRQRQCVARLCSHTPGQRAYAAQVSQHSNGDGTAPPLS